MHAWIYEAGGYVILGIERYFFYKNVKNVCKIYKSFVDFTPRCVGVQFQTCRLAALQSGSRFIGLLACTTADYWDLYNSAKCSSLFLYYHFNENVCYPYII